MGIVNRFKSGKSLEEVTFENGVNVTEYNEQIGKRLSQFVKEVYENKANFIEMNGLTQNFYKVLRGQSPIQPSVIKVISDNNPMLNLHWLFTGEGSMRLNESDLRMNPSDLKDIARFIATEIKENM